MSKLSYEFYKRPTIEVAQDLLGKIINFNGCTGVITETEAYIGQNDPACHASKGMTPRTKVMFGQAGISYVYLIYGMYHCLNFVTEKEGFPAAVLIRGLLTKERHLNGPGKLCRELGITKEHNAVDITKSDDFYVMNSNSYSVEFTKTPRVGIKVGTDKLWRFVMNNDSVKQIKL